MRVELRIGRLVLDGSLVDRSQSGAVAEALRAELSRLLLTVPAGSWQARRMRGVLAPGLRVERGGDPARLGRGIAWSVAAGVSQAAPAGRTGPTRGGGRR